MKRYCYDYPKPSVTADIVVIADKGCERKVLLIKRKYSPCEGMWALPGGFVDENEDLITAALRELKEETGIENVTPVQIGAFGKPGRDPRGHTISIGFMTVIPDIVEAGAGDDAANAEWFSINNLPELAFDHNDIINKALEMETLYKMAIN
ncbi:MAG: NUDIX hydrolase [Cytophagaceae bacterium]|jgi:8-oxo-dGTP diphosphatase|nr:NUDIX hydrolase [Cytophagaceae bacterium]